MIEFPKDPFQKVAVFPLTADLIAPRSGRTDGTLQLGRDVVSAPVDDGDYTGSLSGFHEETITFYEGAECTEVTRTLLVKD